MVQLVRKPDANEEETGVRGVSKDLALTSPRGKSSPQRTAKVDCVERRGKPRFDVGKYPDPQVLLKQSPQDINWQRRRIAMLLESGRHPSVPLQSHLNNTESRNCGTSKTSTAKDRRGAKALIRSLLQRRMRFQLRGISPGTTPHARSFIMLEDL